MTELDWNSIAPIEIPSSLILKHPLVEELTDSLEMSVGNKIEIPYVIPNCKLMSPGTWNNIYYSKEAIHEAFKKTDWKNRQITALYVNHDDNDVQSWVGEVKNVRYKDGEILGDLYIYDLNMALKLRYGQPKFGISPKLEGKTDASRRAMEEFEFLNFSIVVNPAVKSTYLNSADDRVYIEQEVVNLAEEETNKPEAEELKEKKTEDKPAECTEEMKKKREYPYPEPEENATKEKLSEYTDFIKKYIKEHPDADLEEAARAWKEKKKLSELSETDLIAKLSELLELLKKKKYPEPEKIEEINKKVETMSEKIEKIESKLNEPERITTVQVKPANVDSNIVMLEYLKGVSK